MVYTMSLDSKAILEMYDRHARGLVGYFTRRVHDPDLAVELMSETFLAAFTARRECRARGQAQRAAWLYRIAANKLAEHARRAASERRALQRLGSELTRPATEAEAQYIERLAEEADLRGLLGGAVAALSEEQAKAILSRVLLERSYSEVAAELGISEQAARARVSRGLQVLRRAIAPAREGT